MRANHDYKLQQKTHRGKVGQSLPDMAFGRMNRPQTPVNGIIMNEYGERESEALQAKYQMMKQSVSLLSCAGCGA